MKDGLLETDQLQFFLKKSMLLSSKGFKSIRRKDSFQLIHLQGGRVFGSVRESPEYTAKTFLSFNFFVVDSGPQYGSLIRAYVNMAGCFLPRVQMDRFLASPTMLDMRLSGFCRWRPSATVAGRKEERLQTFLV